MTKKEEIVAIYYTEHRQELFAYVSKAVAYSSLSEDILQDVFLKLLLSDKMISPLTLPALVYSIARNLISDYWRHKAHVDNYKNVASALSLNCYYDAGSVYSARSLVDTLEQGMSVLLNDNQQVVYRMNVIDGMKVSEISDVLSKPYKTIESQLFFARKQMREYMQSVI
jgi:RNA polymerase sigma-70 factor (ECF subfamily)